MMLRFRHHIKPASRVLTMKKTSRRIFNQLTMHEAAKLIGVSPMTVSRALNGDPKVRKETRERVLAEIERIG